MIIEMLQKLQLHESYTIKKGCTVMRVPGGLIYQYTESMQREYYEAFAISTHTQFIPFTNFNTPDQ